MSCTFLLSTLPFSCCLLSQKIYLLQCFCFLAGFLCNCSYLLPLYITETSSSRYKLLFSCCSLGLFLCVGTSNCFLMFTSFCSPSLASTGVITTTRSLTLPFFTLHTGTAVDALSSVLSALQGRGTGYVGWPLTAMPFFAWSNFS